MKATVIEWRMRFQRVVPHALNWVFLALSRATSYQACTEGLTKYRQIVCTVSLDILFLYKLILQFI